jgi:hypothetical protein
MSHPPVVDEAPIDDPLVARGRRRVRVGLALNVIGTLALAVVAAAGDGPGQNVGGAGWMGALLTEAALVAAVLSGSRLARGFMIFTGFGSLMGGLSMLLVSRMSGEVRLDMPIGAFAACLLLSATGALLATLGPATGAWYRAVRAARGARRRAHSLADWRRAGP